MVRPRYRSVTRLSSSKRLLCEPNCDGRLIGSESNCNAGGCGRSFEEDEAYFEGLKCPYSIHYCQLEYGEELNNLEWGCVAWRKEWDFLQFRCAQPGLLLPRNLQPEWIAIALQRRTREKLALKYLCAEAQRYLLKVELVLEKLSCGVVFCRKLGVNYSSTWEHLGGNRQCQG